VRGVYKKEVEMIRRAKEVLMIEADAVTIVDGAFAAAGLGTG